MVLFSFEFTKVPGETISARAFKYLLEFKHHVIFINFIHTVYETGLNFTLDNRSTRTSILTLASIACITTRYFTIFTVIFCNSILLTAFTSFTITYSIIMTRNTTRFLITDGSSSIFVTVASWSWNIVYKIDNTSSIILTSWIKFTWIILTAFTNKWLYASTIKLSSSFIVEAYSSILLIGSIQ